MSAFASTSVLLGSAKCQYSALNLNFYVSSYVNYNSVTTTSLDLDYLTATVTNIDGRNVNIAEFTAQGGNGGYNKYSLDIDTPAGKSSRTLKNFNKVYDKTSAEDVYTTIQASADETVFCGHRAGWYYGKTGKPDYKETVM